MPVEAAHEPARHPDPVKLRHLGGPLLTIVSLGVVFALVEGLFTLLLAHPALLRGLPQGLKSHVRRYYLAHDRNMIQAMACCARYDRELYYTLRPGSFRFQNREFDDEFRVNHLGLRDEEPALVAPELIVLGDSYAMGWGVAQDQTIAKLVERETGLRALNAGIASYGSVREMRLLERLDTSRLRYLAIQYCSDDYLENGPFTNHGNSFTVGDEALYREDVKRAERRKRYWFGRRTLEFLRDVLGRGEPPGPEPASLHDQARYFANVLQHAGRTDLSSVSIMAFEIAQSRVVDSSFALALRAELASARYPAHLRRLRALDLTGRLKPEDYYDLDDHLRPSGQQAVAQALAAVIREEQASPR